MEANRLELIGACVLRLVALVASLVASTAAAQEFENVEIQVVHDRDFDVAGAAGEAVVHTDFSQQGAFVAGGTRKGRLAVFDTVTGASRLAVDLALPEGEFLVGLDLASAGTRLLALTSAGQVRVYDFRPNPPTLVVGSVPSGPTAFDVQWAAGRMVVGFRDGAIREFALPGFAPLAELRPGDGVGSVALARYIQGGGAVVTSIRAEDVVGIGLTLWDVATSAPLQHIDGFTGRVEAYFQDGHLIVGSDELIGGTFALGTSNRRPATLRASIAVTRASASTTRVLELTGSALRILDLDAQTGELAQRGVVADFAESSDAFVPDSLAAQAARGAFCSGTEGGAIRVFRVLDRTSSAVLEPPDVTDLVLGGRVMSATGFLHGHSDPVAEVVKSPADAVWVSRSEAGHVIEWTFHAPSGTWSRRDVTRGALAGASVRRDALLAFAPDGGRLAVVEADRRIAVYDTGDYSSPVALVEPQVDAQLADTRAVSCVAWRDAASLVVGGVDGWLAKVDSTTGAVQTWILSAPASGDFFGFSRLVDVGATAGAGTFVAVPRTYIDGISNVWFGTVEVNVDTGAVARDDRSLGMAGPLAVAFGGGVFVHAGDAMLDPKLRGVGSAADQVVSNVTVELRGATSVAPLGAGSLLLAAESGQFVLLVAAASGGPLGVVAQGSLALGLDGPTTMQSGRAPGEVLVGMHSGRILVLTESTAGR